MFKIRRISRLLGASMLAMLFAAAALGQQHPKALLTKRVDPKEFGILADTITVISAVSFAPQQLLGGGGVDCAFSPSFGLACDPNHDVHFYAGLDLPAGAVIDMIGLNSTTDTDAILGVELWARNYLGSLSPLVGFSTTAHGWGTDYSGPLNILIDTHENREYVIDVENASSPNLQYFGWVEVWWHRTVSSPPGSPTFSDVPASDPGFQYIEALVASGVTAGCGGGNYCPDAGLTRRQMAVFLSKALGLQWPN
jgi:hypothetical protein